MSDASSHPNSLRSVPFTRGLNMISYPSHCECCWKFLERDSRLRRPGERGQHRVSIEQWGCGTVRQDIPP